MKKILVLLPLFALLGLGRLNAQVSVNVNLGGPPAWGPYGYNDARFYFIPDIDVYYDCWYGSYWFYDYGVWTCRPSLPPRYANFNLYGCYKVVLNYRGNTPYYYYNNHRIQYSNYRNYNGPRQYTYRDRGYANGYSRGGNHGYNRGGQSARPAYNNGNSRPSYNGNHNGNGGGGRRPAINQNNGGSRPAYNNGNNGGGKRPAYNQGGGKQQRGNSGGNNGGGNGGNRGNGNRGGGGQGHGGGGGGKHR